MVDFGAGTSVFEGALPPSTPIVNPVENRSGETFASALASGVEGFSNFLIAGKDARLKSEAEQAKGSVFVQLDDLITRYADARDQGVGTDEIMRRLRVDINGMVANYPTMADDIHTYANRMMGDSGLASNISKETAAEEFARKEREAAASLYLTPTQYAELKQTGAMNDLVSAKIKNAELQGQQITAPLRAEATVALHSLAASSTNIVTGRIQAAYTELQNVTDPAARAAIIEQVKTDINVNVLSRLGTLKSVSGSDMDLSYLSKGVEELSAQFVKVADGTITKEAYDKQVANVQSRIQATIYQDPKRAALLVLNKEYNFLNPAFMNEADKQGLSMMIDLGITTPVDDQGNPTGPKVPDIVASKEEVGLVFQASKEMMSNIMDDPAAPSEAIANTNTRVGNTLQSIATYGVNETDPRNLTSVANYLADPVFGNYIKAHPEAINTTTASNARDVIDRQYGDVVLKLVAERWAASTTDASSVAPGLTAAELGPAGFGGSVLGGTAASPERVDVSMAIQPVWNGAGIEFKVGDQWKNNAELQRIARDLNVGQEAIAPAINGLVRLSAHMTGSTDYKKVYEDKYAPRLWVGGNTDQTAVKQPADGKNVISPLTENPLNLSLNDFNPEVVQNTIDKSKAADKTALANAVTPIEVAQAYLGLNEGNPEEAQTLAAFISRNTGLEINPAKTAWCAAFVDAVLGAGGSKGTGSLAAKSYLDWGVSVAEPQVGDVVVLWRDSPTSGKGHVGFYMGTNADGTIKILGGNQSDKVSTSNYSADKVLGFRRAA
jgi:uncharacterized protein (TIGR02594 family)